MPSDSPPSSLPAPDDSSTLPLAQLAERVRAQIGRPVDRWAIVATLEGLGLRDVDAPRYGPPDLFKLADALAPLCNTDSTPSVPPRRRSVGRGLLRTVTSYARGLLFVAPMALQIGAVLALGYSLWAWLYFTEAQATVVALGTLLSFVVTGGFVQCIGREGHVYLARQKPYRALRACRRLIGLGMATVGGVALLFLLTNTVFPYYPTALMGISALYFVLLSALWLTLSLLYVADHLAAIAGVMLIGLGPVFAVMTYTEWGIHAAHGLGLVLTVVMSYGYGIAVLRRRARHLAPPDRDETLPPLSIQIHRLRPYFGYGLCFFTFLSVDRIVAWSVAAPEPPPYIIWFRTPYELGVDWALLSLLVTLTVLQHTVQTLSDWLFPSDQSMPMPLAEATHLISRFHLRQLAVTLLVGVLSIIGTYVGLRALDASSLMQDAPPLMQSSITTTVYWGAAVGYLLLAVGLHNLLFPLILSAPHLPLRALLYALGANLAVGTLLSRTVHYEYAVFGLLAGGLVLAVFSLVHTRRFLHTFPYRYYAAF